MSSNLPQYKAVVEFVNHNFRMKLEFLTLVFTVQLLFDTDLVSGEWPNNLAAPLPYLTPSPLAIKTENVRLMNGLSPISVTVPPNDKYKIINNGKTIVATLTKPTTKELLTGSILNNNVYPIRQIFAIFNNEPTDRCGTTVDGQGSTIEMIHIHVKKEYGSIEVAKMKRDGITVLVHRINVEGRVDAPKFGPFANVLKKLIEPGSSVHTTGSTIFGWYSAVANSTSYFISPGSYIEPLTGIRYQSAITVTFNPVIATLSLPQFEYFQNLTAIDGTPLTNTASSFVQGEIPVIQSKGIQVTYL